MATPAAVTLSNLQQLRFAYMAKWALGNTPVDAPLLYSVTGGERDEKVTECFGCNNHPQGECEACSFDLFTSDPMNYIQGVGL